MPSFSIKSDLDEVVRWADEIAPKAIVPAMNRTLNRVGRRIKTNSEKEVSKVKRVKLKLLKAKVRETRSTFRTLRYRAVADARGITWMSLGAKEIRSRSKKGPATKGVRAGRLKSRYAFIAKSRKSRNRQVFVRETDNRYPLRVLRQSLSTPFRRAYQNQLDKYRPDLVTEFKKDFTRRADRLAKKASNR